MEEEEQLLTTKEALDVLKVSRGTLYSYMRSGALQPVEEPTASKLPRLKFRRSDLDKLVLAMAAERARRRRTTM